MALIRRCLFALAVTLGLSGCEIAVLNPTGTIAQQNKEILLGSLAIMLAIVVPTAVAIGLFAWWFRAGNARARYRPDFEYSGQVELVVWSIPTLTVMLLAGVIWIGSHKLDPATPITGEGEPVEIQAISLDWKWLFLYPDLKIATVNQLIAPVGAPLHLRMTSGSVMTAFFVPKWGSMLYVMNGMTSRLNLRVDKPDDTLGRATQISGDGFSDMQFAARAVPRSQFDDWARTAASGPAFDEAAYRELAKQGLAKVETRPLADVNLFDQIVSQKIPPAPGPEPKARPSPLGETRAR